MAVLSTGCSTLKSKESTTSSGPAAATAAADNTPLYYDFGDVMLPRELKVDKSDSFVMNNGGTTSGKLVLKGGIDSNSLIKFFENKMPVDGWRQMGYFRSAQSIMLFEKKSRWCVVLVTEGRLSTLVEIWVAPVTAAGVTGS